MYSQRLSAITLDDLVHSTDKTIREHAEAIVKEYADYYYVGCDDPKRDDGLPLVLESTSAPTPV